MLDVVADLVTGVEYVGCSRSELAMVNAARTTYRVTLGPSFGGYLSNAKFSDALRDVVARVQAVSGDAFASVDFAPAALDDEYGYAVSSALDLITLGNARNLHVVDLVTKLEANFTVRVLRVERIAADAATGDARFTGRDDAAAQTSPNPFTGAFASMDKLILVVILLAIVAGLGYIFPRR